MTPNISAITGMSAKSGAPSPTSQRETVLSDTCSSSAKSFCVIPFAFRSAAINAPMLFLSMGSPLSEHILALLRARCPPERAGIALGM